MYNITIVKDAESSPKASSGKMSNYRYFSIKWLDVSGFEKLDKNKKKEIVKGKLLNADRNDINIPNNYSIEKEERIVVNKKGRYSLDQALFDEKIEMPRHLRDNKKEKKRRRNNGVEMW